MSKLRVSTAALQAALHLHFNVDITAVEMDPNGRTVLLTLEGPDVPATPECRAVFEQICRLEPIKC